MYLSIFYCQLQGMMVSRTKTRTDNRRPIIIRAKEPCKSWNVIGAIPASSMNRAS